MHESVIIARKKNKGRFFCFAVFGKGLSAEVGSINFSRAFLYSKGEYDDEQHNCSFAHISRYIDKVDHVKF